MSHKSRELSLDFPTLINIFSYAHDLDEGYAGESDDEHDFGRGEEVLRRKEASIIEHAFPPDQSTLERTSRDRLIHRADSSDSLDNICPGERRRRSSSITSVHRTKSSSTTAATPNNNLNPNPNSNVNANGDHLRASSERSGSFGSMISDAEIKELMDRDFNRHKLGIGSTVTKPPVFEDFDEDEEMINSEMERKYMREFYETEGWLRPPRPSRATLDARKRTM